MKLCVILAIQQTFMKYDDNLIKFIKHIDYVVIYIK